MNGLLLKNLKIINFKYLSRSVLVLISLLSLSVSVLAQRSDSMSDIPTNQWVVKIAPGSSPQAVAQSMGMAFVGPVGNIPNLFLFEKTDVNTRDVISTRIITNGLKNAPGVVDAEQNYLTQYETRTLLNNPSYANQWHLNNTGQNDGTAGEDLNVIPAWNAGYTGDGVVVASVDDGVYGTDPDLNGNFRADLSYSFNKNSPDVSGGAHGSAVAGTMAADNDDYCGVGVAYNADISGIQILNGYLPGSTIATALNHNINEIDVYNNSWGPYDNGKVWGGASLAMLEALANGATNGRGGLGSIYVWAGGNGRSNGDYAGADGFVNSRFTIAVGASTNYGTQSYYSENGAGIVVNAPSSGGSSSIYTTAGEAYGCVNFFGGTSAAAPQVAGVVALMLEANPNLTWRDVIAILIESAEKNDPTNSEWATNGAGYDIHHGYGFGRVDAAAAVQLASSWTNLDTEQHIDSGTITVNGVIPGNGDYLSSSVNIAEDIQIESVEVIVNATHPKRGDINLELVSPDGTKSILLEKRKDDTGANITDYTFLSMRDWGEMSAGTWTLRATDVDASANQGTLDNWQLKIHGRNVVIPTGALTVNGVSQSEGDSTSDFVFNVTLDNDVYGFTVNYATSNGTATAGEDYTATSGTLTFAGHAGETKTITVSVNGDAVVEADEQFYLTLSDVSNANVSLPVTAIATIKNDDSAKVKLDDVSISEGNSGTTRMTFTAKVVNAVDGGFTVNYATSNDTAIAGEDYTAASGTLTFAGDAGETKTITVSIVGDTTVEADEQFYLTLSDVSNANVSLPATATGTIKNVDSANVTLDDVSLSEGNSGETSMIFTVRVVNAVDGGFTVNYATFNGTAIAGEDYTATSGTLTFAGHAGETKTITVSIIGDTAVEADEQFYLTLSDVSNARVSLRANITGTIENDDRVVAVQLLTNGGFEGDKVAGVPIAWSGNDTTLFKKDKQKCNKPDTDKYVSNSGDCAFMFKGNPTGEKSQIKQNVKDISALTDGVTVTFSAYIDNRSAKVNHATGKLIIKYSNGDKDKLVLRLPDADAYTLVSDSLNINLNGRTIKLVKAQFQNRLSKGKFFIDDASVSVTPSLAQFRSEELLPLPEEPSRFRN